MMIRLQQHRHGEGRIAKGKWRMSNLLLELAALTCAVVLALTIADRVQAAAGIYAPMSYQGKLSNTAGNAITNGQYSIRFKMFDAASGGTQLWSETYAGANKVTTTGGLFSVLLGTQVSMTGSVDFNSDSLYLQVEFDPGNDGVYEEVFTPRRRFASVPYAHNADTLDGRDSVRFVWNDISQVMSGTLTIRPRDATKVGLNIYNNAGTAGSGALRLSTNGANHILFGSGGVNFDTNLYRKSAAVLKTDGAFWANAFSGSDLYARTSLRSSGSLVIDTTGLIKGNLTTRGVLSGASLNVSNLVSCAALQTSTIGGLSCAAGLSTTSLDTRYVNVGGDTMTGVLVIQNGNTHSPTATALLNVRGTISGATLYANNSIRSSGSLVIATTGLVKGNLSTRGTLSGAALTIMNGTSYLMGNVGIGKIAPSTKLDVVGTISGSSFDTSRTYKIRGVVMLSGTGFANTFVGQSAGAAITTGIYNTAVGYQAMVVHTTGDRNTANGVFALSSNTSGSFNTALGMSALPSNTVGNQNVGVGYDALHFNAFGSSNAAVGMYSLFNVTGNENTGLGYKAGQTATSGSGNIFLGAWSDTSVAGVTNAVAIGYKATVGASNTLKLGSGANVIIGSKGTANTKLEVQGTISGSALTIMNGTSYLMGNVGLGTTSPKAKLDVQGSISGTSLTINGNGTFKGASSNVYVDGAVYGAYTSGAGIAFAIGDDTRLVDISVVNTAGLQGAADATKGGLQLGSAGATIFGAGGNLGIGTISPKARLHVVGSGAFTGTLSGSALTINNLVSCAALQTSSIGALSCASGLSQTSLDTRYVNVGGDTMTGALVIQNGNTHTATATPLLNVRGTMSGRSLSITGTGASPLLMTNITTGYVGIGTSSPRQKFEVNGNILLPNGNGLYVRNTANTNNYRVIDMNASDDTEIGPNAVIRLQNGAGTDTLFIDSSNNIGIGKTTVKAKLDVVGTISGSTLKISDVAGANTILGTTTVIGGNGADYGGRVQLNGDYVRIWNSVSNGPVGELRFGYANSDDVKIVGQNSAGLSLYTNGTVAQFINESGYVGINTGSPKARLTVAGSGAFTGTLSGSALTINNLVSCAGIQTSSAGALSCATGLSQTSLDSRYVNVSGDTMTGALVIQNGNTHTPTATALLNVRGTMSGAIIRAQNTLASSGTLVLKKLAGTGTGNILVIDTTGLVYDATNKRVGVGTASPTATVTALSGTTTKMRIDTTAVSGTDISYDLYTGGSQGGSFGYIENGQITYLNAVRGGNLALRTLGSDRLRIDPGGNVGISTTTPKARLHVVGSGAFTGTLSGSALNIQGGTSYILGTLAVGTSATNQSKFSVVMTTDGGTAVLSTPSFSANGTVGLEFNYGGATGGNVGNISRIIGETGVGGGGGLKFETAASNIAAYATKMTLTQNGNLGIGTTVPKARLHVVGSGAFTGTLSGSALNIQGGTSYVLGNLGIGTTAPKVKLQVNGAMSGNSLHLEGVNLGVQHQLEIYGTGGAYAGGILFGMSNDANNKGVINFGAGTNQLSYSTTTNGSSYTQRLLIDQAGNMVLGAKTTAATKLDVVGTISGSLLTISNPTGSNYMMGKLGIGTTSPQQNLDVAGTINSQYEYRLSNLSYARVAVLDGGGGFLGGYNIKGDAQPASAAQHDSLGSVAGVWYQSAGTIFYNSPSKASGSAPVESMRIVNATGNVGINSSSPTVKFLVAGSGAFTGTNTRVSIGKATAMTALDVVGTISGSALSVSGLSSCAALQTSSAGALSCAAGLSQTSLDTRYVNVSGDTMTGTLVIQNGNTHTPTATPLLNVRGTISGALVNLNSTGTNYMRGNLAVGTGSTATTLLVYSAGSAVARVESSNPILQLYSNYSTPSVVQMYLSGVGQMDLSANATNINGNPEWAINMGASTESFSILRAATPTGSRTEFMHIDSSGRMAIGKSGTATAKLDVVGTISGSAITLNGPTGMTMRAGNATWSIVPSGADLAISSNTTGQHMLMSGTANTTTLSQVVNLNSGVNITGTTNQAGGVVNVTSESINRKGMVIKGFASQSGKLLEFQNSSATPLSSFSSSGWLTINKIGSAKTQLDVVGTISGSALTVSGLFVCAALQTSSVGALSCATGLSQTSLDSRFVNVSGDTMTGALVIQNGNTHSPTSTALLNVRGTMSGAIVRAQVMLASSGSIVLSSNTDSIQTINSAVAAGGTMGELNFKGSRGTLASPSNVSAGDIIGKISWSGKPTNDYFATAFTQFVVTDGTTCCVVNGRLSTYITSASDGVSKPVLNIVSGGNVGVGNNNLAPGAQFVVSGSTVIGNNIGTRAAKAMLDVVGTISGSALLANGTVTINNTAAASKALVVKAARSQSANLFEVQGSGGTAMSYIDPSGTMTINSTNQQGGLILGSSNAAQQPAMFLQWSGVSRSMIYQAQQDLFLLGATTGTPTMNFGAGAIVSSLGTAIGTDATSITYYGPSAANWGKWTSTGLGIGATSPGAKLVVSGSTVIGNNIGTRAAKAQLDVVGTISGTGLQVNGTGVIYGPKNGVLATLKADLTGGGDYIDLKFDSGVGGSTDNTIRMEADSFASGGRAFEIRANGSEIARFRSDGNVGIGSTSPSVRLLVAGSGAFTGTNSRVSIGKATAKAQLDVVGTISGSALTINGTSSFGGSLVPLKDNAYDLGTSSTRWRSLYLSGGSLHIGSSAMEGKIGYKTNGFEGMQFFGSGGGLQNSTPQMFLSSGGLLGIGTVAPAYPLHVVAAGAPQAVIDSTSSTTQTNFELAQGGNLRWALYVPASSTDFRIYNRSTATNVMTFQSSDNTVGIGTTTPKAKLDVVGTISGSALSISNPSATNYIQGDVGIGTISPAVALHILRSDSPEIRISDTLGNFGQKITFYEGGVLQTTIRNATSASGDFEIDTVNNILLKQNGAIRVFLNQSTGNMGFGKNVTPSAKFTFSGAMVIGNNIGAKTAKSQLDVVGTISGSALSITGNSLYGTSNKTYTFTRTIPTTVNDEVDIGDFTSGNGGQTFTLSIVVSDGGFSVTKQYLVPAQYDQTSNTWTVVQPIDSTGAYSGNDFALDVRVSANVTSFRIRRTAGSTAGSAIVRMTHDGAAGMTAAFSSATASVAAPTTIFTSNPLTQVSGNVGIGTIAPKAKLDVVGTISGSLITQNGAGSNYFMGNVGIGKTSPSAKLDVLGTISGTNIIVSGTTAAAIQFGADTSANLYRSAAASVKTDGDFLAAGAIKAHGLMQAGIGYTNYLNFQGVASGQSPYIITQGESTSGLRLIGGTGNLTFETAAGTITRMTILGANGYTGIGKNVTAPAAQLVVSGSMVIGNNIGTRAAKAQLDVVGTISGSLITQNGAGNNYFMGSVGIGVTSPGAQLTVTNSAGANAIRIDGAVGSNHALEIYSGGAYKWGMYVPGSTSDIRFYDGTADRVTFESGGDVGIGSTAPKAKLDVVGTISGTGLQVNGTGNFRDALNVNTLGTASAVLTLTGDTPHSASVDLEGYADSYVNYYGAGSTSTLNWRSGVASNFGFSNAFVILNGTTSRAALAVNKTTNNVGIGAVAPGAQFVVSGSTVIGNNIGTRAAKAQLDVVGTISGASLVLNNTAAATKALVVRGAPSQSANLLEFSNNSASIVGYIALNGISGFDVQMPSFHINNTNGIQVFNSQDNIYAQIMTNMSTRTDTSGTPALLTVGGPTSSSNFTWAPNAANTASYSNTVAISVLNAGASNSGGRFYNNQSIITETSATGLAARRLYSGGTGTQSSYTEKFFVDTTGSGYFLGNLGLGTLTPHAKLDVVGTISGSLITIANPTGANTIAGRLTVGNSTLGGNSLTVTGSGTISGRLGINKTQPAQMLHVKGGIRQEGASNSGYIDFLQLDQNIFGFIGNGAGNYVLALDEGNTRVGMGGVGAPKATLDVRGTISGSALTISGLSAANCDVKSTNGVFSCGTDAGSAYTAGQGLTLTSTTFSLSNSFSGTALEIMGTSSGRILHAQDQLRSSGSLVVQTTGLFKSNLTTRSVFSGAALTIMNGTSYLMGNVGIGKTSPTANLDVIGTVSGTVLNMSGPASTNIIRGTLAVGKKGVSTNTSLDVAGTISGAALTIMSGTSYLRGNVGIGKTSPSTKLDVVGTVSGSLLTISNPSGTNYLMGNVGIGTTAPKAKLDVVGAISGTALTVNGTALVRQGLAVNGLVISGERKHTVGDSAALAATSCSEIKAYRPSAPSGQYWIQPNSSIAAFQAYCDMITDGGGWTIVTAVSGADGEQPLVSDTEATGSSPLTYNAYNISRAKKMALSLVSNEFMVRRNNGKWLKTNAAPFDQNLNTSNVHVDNAVTITASDGTTTTGVQGYSNYNITGGGDFGIVTAAGFDHHSTTYHHLNSGCGNSYLYSYSNTAADSDAGYDVNTALGDWDVTSSCEAGEGGTLVAYFAVRSTFNNSNARFGGAVGINTANVSSGSALTVSGAVVIMRAGTNVGRMPKAQLDVVGSISGSALSIMGNAGVGIASPLSKLHVKNTAAGDVIRADYTAAAAANYALSAYNDSGTMTFGVGTFSGYYEGQIFLTAPSGQGAGAGLNFTAGASKTGLFQLDSAGNMVFRNNNTGAGTYFDAATGGTFFRNNSGLSIVTTITNAGDVGIGTTTPGARLSVSGSTVIGYGIGSRAAKAQLDVIGTISGSALTVTSLKTCAGIQTNGNGVTSCTSDATLKDIQGSFTKGLSAIRLINPQTYSWKADSGLYDNGVLYSGFIAQNVQTGLPEAVNTGGNGKLQISQLTILAALVNGEKELDARTNSSAYLSIRGLALSGTGLIVSRTQTGSTNLFTMRSNVVSNDNTVFRVTAGGDVYADGAFNSGGADYAEYFRSDDSQTLTPGDLVCIDTTKNNAVRKCRTASDPNLMGIVSTHPAYIGNSKQGESLGLNGLPVPGYVLVGLIGQVPAKAIVEPGAVIQPGDSLTSAALAGFARKANPGETTVGVALEGLSSGQGVINVLISRTNKSLTVESLEAHVRDEIAAMEIGDEIQSRLNIALSGSTLAQNILDQAFDQVTPVVDALANRITDLEARVSNQESVGSGQTVVSVQGPVSSDLTLTGSVNAGTLSAENTLTVGSDTRIGGDLYLEGVLRVNAILVPGGLTVDGQLTTGKLTAASGSVVTGMLAVDDLMINHQLNFGTGSTINAQDLFVRGAMEVVGPITIHGLAQFLGDVEVQGELIVSAKQAGYALIHTGETSVFVSFGSGGFNAIPVVTASPDVPVLYAVSKASATGFTLRLAGPATEDVNFSWLALGTKTQHTASGAVITSTIAFPVDANGVPVSAQPIWNACIRNIPTFDSEGQPFNCSRYHTDTTWEHPDLNINFIWNDGMTPAYLDLPQGYVATITGPATLPESSSSSSVSSSDSSSSVSSDSSSSSSEISSESSSSSSSDEPIIIDLGSSSSSEQSSSSEAASSSESGGSAGGSSSSGN